VQKILVLLGPTASGKSALGVRLAQAFGGVIINADTMQCYSDLSIITARPIAEEMQGVDHRLYAIWDATTHGNAAMWQERAVAEIRACHASGQLPILLGGTGIYVKALMDGIAPVPPIDPALHEATKARFAKDPEGFYAELLTRDPVMAARLKPRDTQRLIRAMEVLEQTGVSLDRWQKEPVTPHFDPQQFVVRYMDIPREVLYQRIDARFVAMVQAGAVEEIRALIATLMAAYPDADVPLKGRKYNTLPLLRAHGVPELMAYALGETTREEAIAKGQQNTRNYAKRQLTWIRNQLTNGTPIPYDLLQDTGFTQEFLSSLAKVIDRMG